jgi:hypothetical protein
MRRVCWFLCGELFVLLFGGAVSAQYGTAPNNYYPNSYNGSTFTGKVVRTTDDTITLTYTHGSKTDTFEGHLTSPCYLPSSKTTTGPMSASQVQMGAVITAFYEGRTVKVEGRKQKENQVIAISFLQVNGRTVTEDHRAIFFCIPAPFHTYFKAFQ